MSCSTAILASNRTERARDLLPEVREIVAGHGRLIAELGPEDPLPEGVNPASSRCSRGLVARPQMGRWWSEQPPRQLPGDRNPQRQVNRPENPSFPQHAHGRASNHFPVIEVRLASFGSL